MAKIIKKGHHLEERYFAIKKEQADNYAKNMRTFGRVAFVFIVIYGVAIIASMVSDILLRAFIPLTVCLGLVLLTAVFACFGDCISQHGNTEILVSGITGERIAAKTLAMLPDSYTVFQDVTVTYDNEKSEIDNIVIGRSGIFIVEVKNHNGHIVGDLKDKFWTQHKVGRGGTPYTNQVYNPAKQVGTHIYCLANYLRQNGVDTYIEGMVYFANKACLVNLTGDSNISVYASSDGGEERLCRQILSGDHNLEARSLNHVCRLMNQL